MNRRATVLLMFLLSACATTNGIPIALNQDSSLSPIRARAVIVDDFTVERTDDSNWVYKSGWMPIPSGATIPTFAAALIADLRHGLRPSSKTNDATVQIAVLEAGLFMDKKAADDIAFAGLVMALRERQYQCRVTVNVRVRDESHKMVFDAEEKANRAFSDLDTIDAKRLVENCKATLVREINDYVIQRTN